MANNLTNTNNSGRLIRIAAGAIAILVVVIGFVFQAMSKRIDGLAQDIRDMRTGVHAWQSDHDLRVRGLNAAQWERIKSLERKIYGRVQGPANGEAYGAQ